MEVTKKSDFYATLVASGYAPEEVERLTVFLDSDDGATQENLTAHRRLYIAETLSLHWLVNELRQRAQSRDSSPEAAVEALRALTDISAKFGGVLKV